MAELKKFNNFLSENNDSRQQKKLYKTVIKVEVLSEEPLNSDNSLEDISYMITDGECSGKIDFGKSETLYGKKAVFAIKNQGSSPEFFQMDDEGFELE